MVDKLGHYERSVTSAEGLQLCSSIFAIEPRHPETGGASGRGGRPV